MMRMRRSGRERCCGQRNRSASTDNRSFVPDHYQLPSEVASHARLVDVRTRNNETYPYRSIFSESWSIQPNRSNPGSAETGKGLLVNNTGRGPRSAEAAPDVLVIPALSMSFSDRNGVRAFAFCKMPPPLSLPASSRGATGHDTN